MVDHHVIKTTLLGYMLSSISGQTNNEGIITVSSEVLNSTWSWNVIIPRMLLMISSRTNQLTPSPIFTPGGILESGGFRRFAKT